MDYQQQRGRGDRNVSVSLVCGLLQQHRVSEEEEEEEEAADLMKGLMMVMRALMYQVG